MKIRFLLALLGIAMVLGAPASSRAQTIAAAKNAQRINVAAGSIAAQVKGQFTRQDQGVSYVVRMQAGQHLVVNLIAVAPGLATSGTVIAPSGAQDGSPGGVVFSANVKETGDYTIKVSPRPADFTLPAAFVVEVVITPGWVPPTTGE